MQMLLTHFKKIHSKGITYKPLQVDSSHLFHQLALLAWGTLQPMLLQICPTWRISFVDKGKGVFGHPLAHTSDQITQFESKICQT